MGAPRAREGAASDLSTAAAPGGRPAHAPASAAGRGRLIVDGSNVIGCRPDGWWRDRAGARRRLAALLDLHGTGAARSVGADPERAVLLVHDGRPHDCPADEVEVRFAPVADDLIAELARPGDVVATSDRELVGRVRAAGAATVGARRLRDLVDAG